MKKIITTFLLMTMMAIMIPLTANAQTRNSRYYKQPNIYDRHRKSINIGAGGAGGALLGALIGGKKGAAIGALLGAGGGAIFTAKQKSRNYYKVYR